MNESISCELYKILHLQISTSHFSTSISLNTTPHHHQQQTIMPSAPIDFDPIVTTLLIGPDQRCFDVHKSILCHYSGYFRRAYESPARTEETELHLFVLGDGDGDVFSALVSWMHTGMVFPKEESRDFLVRMGVERPAVVGGEQQQQSEGEESDNEHEEEDEDEGKSPKKLIIEKRRTTIERPRRRARRRAHLRATIHPRHLPTHAPRRRSRRPGPRPTPRAHPTGRITNPRTLARGKVEADPPKKEASEEDNNSGEVPSICEAFDIITDLYLLATRLEVPLLRREILENMHAEVRRDPPVLPFLSTVARGFESLHESDELRELMVRVFAYGGSGIWMEGGLAEREGLPREFLVGVIRLMARRLEESGEAEDGIGPLEELGGSEGIWGGRGCGRLSGRERCGGGGGGGGYGVWKMIPGA